MAVEIESKKIPLGNWKLALALGLVFALAVFMVIAFARHAARVLVADQGSRRAATIRINCYCATSYDGVSDLLRAYAESDAAAMYGWIARGRAIELRERTKVYTLTTENDVTAILIESGFHVGQTCYLSDALIKY